MIVETVLTRRVPGEGVHVGISVSIAIDISVTVASIARIAVPIVVAGDHREPANQGCENPDSCGRQTPHGLSYLVFGSCHIVAASRLSCQFFSWI
jgi:hypothetical protein